MMNRCRNKKCGFTLFELVVSLTIIALFVGTMLIFIHRTATFAKETALQAELKSLRHSLVLYKVIKKKNPEDLRILIEAKYSSKSLDKVLFREEFLETVGRDAQGYPIDPFGNRFYYNPQSGTVNSLTEGYQNW